MNDRELTERVGEALRKECLAIFGSTWSYDNAWRLADVAIEAAQETKTNWRAKYREVLNENKRLRAEVARQDRFIKDCEELDTQ